MQRLRDALKSKQEALPGQIRGLALINKPVFHCSCYINYTPAPVGLLALDKVYAGIGLEFRLKRPRIQAERVHLYRLGLFKEERDLSPSKRVVSNKTASLELRLERARIRAEGLYLYPTGLFKGERDLSPSKPALSNKTTSLGFRPQGLDQHVGGPALSRFLF